MLFDSEFIANLPPSDLDGWSWALHGALQDLETETAGILFTAKGRPFAVVWSKLTDLHACEVSPGALLGYALWWGADGMLPFHTQVTPPEWKVEDEDFQFAHRLRDLAQLLGPVTVHDHLLVTRAQVPILLDESHGLREPLSLRDMERWERTVKLRPKPRYRHPLGPTWTGTGTVPAWVDQLESFGLPVELFAVDVQGPDEPLGVPPGAEMVYAASDAPPALAPVPGLDPIPALPDLAGVPTPAQWAAALQPFVRQPEPPQVGVVFLDDQGQPLRPRAGWTATAELARSRPEVLLRSALADGATAAVTFTIHGSDAERFDPDRRDLVRHLVFQGRLLGLVVRDHLVLRTDGRWLALEGAKGRSSWPDVPPVDEAAWPPFRRNHQSAKGYAHPAPGDDRFWSGRGPKPGWVNDLIAAGWLLDELKTYS